MTTVEKEHNFKMFCLGKSNKKVYSELCSKRGIRRNSWLAGVLGDVPDVWDMRRLDLEGNYLGAEGVRALLGVVQANIGLEHLGLAAQGVDDECMVEVLEVLRAHPRIRTLDLRGNVDITDASSHELISVFNDNVMLCGVQLEGSSVAKALQRRVYEIAERNKNMEADFFKGDYLKMKQLFTQLDTDLSGLITMSELLTNIEIPQVAATLMEKFKYLDGNEGAKDQAISINEFLNFVYPHYKTVEQIKSHSKMENSSEKQIVANHMKIASAMKLRKIVAQHYKLIRIEDRELSIDEINGMLERALEIESTEDTDEPAHIHGKIVLSWKSLKQGLNTVYTRPAKTLEEKRKDFSLPPSIVKQLIRLCDPEPTFTTLLATTFETPLMKLKPSILIPIIRRHGLSLSLPVTLQEAVTIFEEYYTLIAFEKSV